MNAKTLQFNEKISIRSLKASDLDRAAELWLACFQEDDRAFVDYYFARRTCPERMLGLFEAEGDGRTLVSMLCFEKRRMYAGITIGSSENTVDTLFIAGVCTDPAKRRRGYIRRLFSELERRAAAEGVGVFLLQPFDFAFYEKLGYKPFAKRKTVFVEPGMEAESGFAVVRPTAEKMLAAYKCAFAGKNGVLERTLEHCRAIIEEYSLHGAEAAAVQRGGEYAYALWYREALPIVDEFVFTGEKARAALEAELAMRLGGFCYPAPAKFGDDAVSFNMAKTADGSFHLIDDPEWPPFDFTKY